MRVSALTLGAADDVGGGGALDAPLRRVLHAAKVRRRQNEARSLVPERISVLKKQIRSVRSH